ncbi:MAG: guanitoxin biosynthesis heme-dependent pre-guanitoxin N-hydroxylase GntA [Hyphomicrobiales bacterium]|nr:guanitoxin biosynthesis heme-dependent pre-guanitoxin N-hydroxylase GntA [Hyphomicrobiales bacterium]
MNQTDDLIASIRAPAFPCVGAKAAVKRGQILIHEAGLFTAGEDDAETLGVVRRFVADYRASPTLFKSLVIRFSGPRDLSEAGFERALWRRLQALHALDGEPWDARVSNDADHESFGYSLAGEAFFIIGLHPNAARASRRAPTPTLVFNLHDQFERLRADGRYDAMRDAIRKRDEAFCGRGNPMLRDFGEASEARQYSGRDVPPQWRCPFRAKAGGPR